MKNFKLMNAAGGGAVLIAIALLLNACGGGSDSVPAPKSSFSYKASEREVTFTNTSTNAETFAWDFGDGEVSTDKNPVHTYEVYGKYTVKLAVVGKGGAATSLPDEITLAKSSAVVIDGTFTEWANVPVSSSLAAGTLTRVKVDYDALNIYFYVEGTTDMTSFFDLYLNTDNNIETEFSTPDWIVGLGAEVLIEGDVALNDGTGAILYGWDTSSPNTTTFDFNVDAPLAGAGSGFIKGSELKVVGDGKAIEFSISRASLANLSSAGFTYGLENMNLDPWGQMGSVPAVLTETSESQFVDLTK